MTENTANRLCMVLVEFFCLYILMLIELGMRLSGLPAPDGVSAVWGGVGGLFPVFSRRQDTVGIAAGDLRWTSEVPK